MCSPSSGVSPTAYTSAGSAAAMGSEEDEVPAAASRVMMRLEGREACRRGARAAVRGLEGRRAWLDGAAMDARVGANDVDMLEASRGGGASATTPYLTRCLFFSGLLFHSSVVSER